MPKFYTITKYRDSVPIHTVSAMNALIHAKVLPLQYTWISHMHESKPTYAKYETYTSR